MTQGKEKRPLYETPAMSHWGKVENTYEGTFGNQEHLILIGQHLLIQSKLEENLLPD